MRKKFKNFLAWIASLFLTKKDKHEIVEDAEKEINEFNFAKLFNIYRKNSDAEEYYVKIVSITEYFPGDELNSIKRIKRTTFLKNLKPTDIWKDTDGFYINIKFDQFIEITEVLDVCDKVLEEVRSHEMNGGERTQRGSLLWGPYREVSQISKEEWEAIKK